MIGKDLTRHASKDTGSRFEQLGKFPFQLSGDKKEILSI